MQDIWQWVGRLLRRWPLYSVVVAGVLATFVGLGLSGRRLLGDDNETDASEQVSGAPRAGGHGGAARFYHK